MNRAACISLLALLLSGCASSPLIKDEGISLGSDEVIILARIRIVARVWDLHKVPPSSLEPVKMFIPDSFTLSSGGKSKGPVYLGLPNPEQGEIRFDLERGDSVVAVRVEKGKRYSIGHYDDSYSTYYPGDPLVIAIPDEGIAYIGDITLDTSPTGGAVMTPRPGSHITQGGTPVEVVDNEASTVAALKLQFPALFKKYPYKKLMAVTAR
jgi:hypothetical protein